DGDVGDLTPQLLARAADVGLRLRPRGLDEQLRLAARGLHQLALLLRGFLERRRADRLRFGIGGADALGALLLLPGGLGARGLRRLQRGLDGHAALLHLREERCVEKAVEDGEKDQEVEHLDDQRLVEPDEAPAATTVAGAGRWPWRIRASTRSGSRGGAQAMKFTSVAVSRSRSRPAAGPTVRRLAPASMSVT